MQCTRYILILQRKKLKMFLSLTQLHDTEIYSSLSQLTVSDFCRGNISKTAIKYLKWIEFNHLFIIIVVLYSKLAEARKN